MNSRQRKLVLAGNPNVGKSVFFNALTGAYADVSNFPGTTVDVSVGSFHDDFIIDTPGVYGISELNDEERVARKALLDADLILNVVDATHLERDLFLTLQLLSLGKPMLVALNMMDDVERRGILLRSSELSRELGVPVVPTSGKTGQGLSQIKELLLTGTLSRPSAGVEQPEDGTALRARADRLASQVLFRPHRRRTCSERMSAAFLNPLLGLPLLAFTLAGIFLFIGKFVAQTVVGFTQDVVMGTWYYNAVVSLFSRLLNPDSLLGCLLFGEYGLLTMVPIYLLGLLLPLVAAFYLLMSLLEDSGLLPRIAVLSDQAFTKLGLNGKAIIPMLLGFGCVTMALITTRILGSARERLIATVLLCVAIPCSAQFAILLAVASSMEPYYLAVYAAAIFLVFAVTGVLLNKILPGRSTDLFLTLPPLRLPTPGNVIKKTARKAKHFLTDAGPMFLLGGFLISILNYSGGFAVLRRWMAPVTSGLLGLPEETATLFVLSVIKRDLGAAELYSIVRQNLLTQPQLAVTLTVMTLFVPCFASVMILFKERKPLDALLIWAGSFVVAFTAGAAVSAFLR